MNIIERNHSKARMANTKSPGDRKQMETLPGEDTADTVLPKRSEPARNRKKYKESTQTSVQAYRNQVTQGLAAPCITSELLEQQTRLLTVLTRIEVDGIQGRHVIANTQIKKGTTLGYYYGKIIHGPQRKKMNIF